MDIPLSSPDIGEREVQYVANALRSRQLSLGSWLQQFEERFAEYTGTRYAIAANSGTSALHMCVRALRIGPGDEVITTAFSFVASANCVLYEGATPIFLDIDPDTLNLDPVMLREFLRRECKRMRDGRVVNLSSGQTVKAILPVHVFGIPCEMDAIEEVANEYNLRVLEDACEAIGARYRGRAVGTFGDAAVFAFYPNKQITSAEGGMVVTNDPGIAEECRSLRNQGRDADGRWLKHVRLGFNYRLSDIHCALGLAQLERVGELLTARERVAATYSRFLRESRLLRLPAEQEGAVRSWFVYVVQILNSPGRAVRDSVRERLGQAGIATQVYFPAIHRQPYFARYYPGPLPHLPNTDYAANTCLALPFSSQLRDADIRFVCQQVNNCLAEEAEQCSAAISTAV